MRISILAVGKLKSGPERDLCSRYLDRAQKAGRPLGLTRIEIREWSESRAIRSEDRKSEEAQQFISESSPDSVLFALDEHGTNLSSVEFATSIATFRDKGTADLIFAIGGPDGHGSQVLARAHQKIAFGSMTWPHQIIRVLLAEQIYRATTILSGHPYHRV